MSGSIFGLSGWFFVYSNSQWFRTYLYLGFLIAFVEWTLRSKRRLPIVLLAVSIAGMVAIGMPEPTFMALFAGALYAIVRLLLRSACRMDGGTRSSVSRSAAAWGSRSRRRCSCRSASTCRSHGTRTPISPTSRPRPTRSAISSIG